MHREVCLKVTDHAFARYAFEMPKEERERRAREEIAELDRQYREGRLWTEREYEQRKAAIREKWGLQ